MLLIVCISFFVSFVSFFFFDVGVFRFPIPFLLHQVFVNIFCVVLLYCGG